MKNKYRQFGIHAACIIAFLSLPFFFAPEPLNFPGTLQNPFTLREFAAYALMILVFYLNYYYVIPRFYFKREVLYFISINLVCLAVVTVLPSVLTAGAMPPGGPHHDFPFPPPPPPPGHGHRPFLFDAGHNFFLFLVVLFVSLTARINERLRKTEKQRMNAELSYLRAQINPHFLFNTLNSIYSLAIQKSDKTAPAVVKLSAMMRYVTTEAHNDMVSLDKEFNYTTNYIELQKIRLGETAVIDYTTSGNPQGKQIAPLLLIPFIENAFKHGVNPEENSAIKISLDIRGNELHLQARNRKVSAAPSEEGESGTGIENARQRLNLLYPKRYLLTIDDGDEDFIVSLHINLQ
jgi:hypothetical protein